MTREEHIYELKRYLKGISKCMVPASSLYWKEHYEEIIKALEQEPILDKIRAEIGNALSDGMIHKKTVLGIIDKYKAETEDT